MRVWKFMLAAALTVSLPADFAFAAPAAPSEATPQNEKVHIPFDPPLDVPLKYKWEKAVEKNGKTEMDWQVSEYRFEKMTGGYRLTITPISAGSNETDPAALALSKRLEELMRRPYVLRLDENGTIEQLEDADFYWATIFKVMREELGKNDGKPLDDNGKRMLEDVMHALETMPAENRLALLTEDVQPVLEFGNVEINPAEPISAPVELPSPFGGTVRVDVQIVLEDVDDGIASLSLTSSIPKEELTKMLQAMFQKLESLPADKRQAAMEVFAGLKDFRKETTAEYDISLEDGILVGFDSVETVYAADDDISKQQVTKRSLRFQP